MVQLGLGHAAVAFQCPDSGYHHHGAGPQTRQTALDVQELFRAQICAEAGLGHSVIAQLQGHAGGGDGVAAVGDVGEGTAVDQGVGVPSSVCTRLGFSASFSRAVIAPSAFRSWAVTGLPS